MLTIRPDTDPAFINERLTVVSYDSADHDALQSLKESFAAELLREHWDAGVGAISLPRYTLGPVIEQLAETEFHVDSHYESAILPGGALYQYQVDDVDYTEDRLGRVLIGDDVGLGKTPTAIAWLHRRPDLRPALIVCPAQIKLQWVRNIARWLGMDPDNISLLKSRKAKPIETPIAVINYDILRAWLSTFSDWRPQVVILDELHMLKEERSARSKAALTICRMPSIRSVIGLSGTPAKSRPRELWHPVLTVNPTVFPNYYQYAQRYCCPPEAPIWMGDFTFKALGDIRIGDQVIGWASHHNGRRNYTQTQRAYLTKTTVVNILRRKAPIVKLTMESGRIIRCTPDHRWLSRNGSHLMGVYNPHTNPTRRYIYIVPEVGSKLGFITEAPAPLPTELEHAAGWLGGMYDGEGTWPRIAQSHTANPDVYQKLLTTMEKLQFPYRECADGILFYGGRTAAHRFQQWCHPSKLEYIEKEILASRFLTPDTVLHIADDGVDEVVSLTTNTGNYIAWGYASSNCSPERIKTTAKKLDGNTLKKDGTIFQKGDNANDIAWNMAWDYSGASNLDELDGRLRDTVLIRHLRQEVANQLPPLTVESLAFECDLTQYRLIHAESKRKLAEYRQQWREAEAELEALPPEARTAAQAERAEVLSTFKIRGFLIQEITALKLAAANAMVAPTTEWVQEFLTTGAPLVLFCHHREVASALHANLLELGIDIPDRILNGTATQLQRQKIVDEFADGRYQMVICGLQAMAVGVDRLQERAAHVALMELGWSPTDHRQAIGRLWRTGQTKPVSAYFLLAAGTIYEIIANMVDIKSVVTGAMFGEIDEDRILEHLVDSILEDA